MQVSLVEEHEDGSATYTFDMTDEEKNLLVPSGIQLALLLGITGMSYSDLAKLAINEVENNGD
jgi:hypothetical protein